MYRKESVVRYEPRGHGGIAISGGDQHMYAGMMFMDPMCEQSPSMAPDVHTSVKMTSTGWPEVRNASASVAFFDYYIAAAQTVAS